MAALEADKQTETTFYILANPRGWVKKIKKAKQEHNMKTRMVKVVLGVVLAFTCFTYAYNCYTTDPPNKVNCATAGVDTGTVVGKLCGDNPITGICSETVDKDAIKAVYTGQGKTSNVTCTCSCTYLCGGTQYTGTCNLNKYYDKLNNSACPSQ